MPEWPNWWSWELELTPHVLKRMIDRQFSETDLRDMIESTTGIRMAEESGRWIAETKFEGRDWNVVLEPIDDERLLLVITAYRVERTD